MSPRTIHRPNPALSRPGPQPIGPPVGGEGSWASVAAKPVDGDNQLIKFRPSDSVVHRYVEEGPKQSEEDARVVWIKGWDAARPLAAVTKCVSQGPLLSVVYSEEYGAVCLIFQNPSSARELLRQDARHQATAGVSRFGRGCSILPGLPYSEDEDIRRMSHPLNERRRLTFARSQLFANGITEDVFKNDIYRLVGKANVELVWLFNTGNGRRISFFSRAS
jgi:hypothetical protein